jgi:hypothetical protein
MKLSLCLITYALCEDIWGNRGTVTPFLTLALDGVCGQLHALVTFPLRKEFPVPIDRKLGGHQSWSGSCVVEKDFLSLLGIEPWPSSP